MNYKIRIMTTLENEYGYTPFIEELQMVARGCLGNFLYKNHDPSKEPTGRIVNTEIVYDKELECLAVVGIVEVFNADPESFEKRGFSGAYSYGGFEVDESDGTDPEVLIIDFDAYNTNEIQLYLNAKSLSKELNKIVLCRRTRRHDFGIIPTTIMVTIGAYFINKILDDIELYEKFKKFILNVSKENDAGQEIRLDVCIPAKEKEFNQNIKLHFSGSNDELEKITDHQVVKDLLRTEEGKLEGEHSNLRNVTYSLTMDNGRVKIRKSCAEQFSGKVDYFG